MMSFINHVRSPRECGIMVFLITAFFGVASMPVAAQSVLTEVVAPEANEPTLLKDVRTAYREGRDQDAVLMADKALASASAEETPQTLGELHFWRGAALRRLERYQESLVALDTASSKGFVYPELHLERALSKRALGQEEAAEQDYREMERLLQEDPDRLRELTTRWERRFKKEQPFQFWFTPQMGYDTNIIGVDEDTPLKGGDLERESFYGGAVLDMKYYLVQESNEQLYLQAKDYVRGYAEESDLSYNETVISAGGRYAISPWADFEARLSWSEAWLSDDGHHRTTRSVAPAVVLHPIRGLPVKLWTDWTDADYYDTNLIPEEDRDGVLVRVGVTLAIDLGNDWSLAPGVSVADYDAEGDDFIHSSWTVGVALRSPMYIGCKFTPSIGYSSADYDKLNSTANFLKKREDRILKVALRVTITALEEVIEYAPTVTFVFVDHGSNIDAFDYERFEPRVEMGILAIAF